MLMNCSRRQSGMTAADILEYQLDTFRRTLEQYRRIVARNSSSFMGRAKAYCAMQSFMNLIINTNIILTKMLLSVNTATELLR